MHFMGTAGMPRRISDYPDSFAALNHVASLGSMVSVASALLFFYIILDALLVQKRTAAKATWSSYTSSQCKSSGELDVQGVIVTIAVIAILCVGGAIYKLAVNH